MSQLMESVTETAALQLASPISVESCSSAAGFRGCSGSIQPQRLVEEFARTLLSPRMFFFCKYKKLCLYTVVILLWQLCDRPLKPWTAVELWTINRWTGFNVGQSYHVVYRYVTAPPRLLALWVVPYGVYEQLRVNELFEVWICSPCWCAWQSTSGLATPLRGVARISWGGCSDGVVIVRGVAMHGQLCWP